ncbi:MAG: sensor histidine kinase, partial [Candidatus Cloacimonadales bacterium]|nr:sensor histidine kinase [Candidatus Cloacimonadales bacterium]
ALNRNILLMREMNHRVKNNLATIQSLLRIQSQQTMDEKSRMVLIESESRLKSITHLHQMLSKDVDLNKVNVVSYIHKLVNDITSAFDNDTTKIKIEMDIQEVDLDMNILVPFALILNELITNAFKYAFKDNRKGILKISLAELNNNQVALSVQDNGVGLPPDFDPEKIDSLGTIIIRLLIEQIKGELKYSSEPGKGTIFKVSFNK